MAEALEARLDHLKEVIAGYGSVVVAFSGGVDSALVAYLAHDVLGAGAALAATAVSPSLAESELDDCQNQAEAWGMDWRGVTTDELSRPQYVANGADRCYHCKSELMNGLGKLAADRGATILLGVNLDDLGDHRPGQQAAKEQGARFPLVDAGFTKVDVRAAARLLGLEVWDKPAAACLASRVPYGTPVQLGTLRQVADAEAGLKALGFTQLRVRHYGDLARVELPVEQLPEAVTHRESLIEAVRSAGYRYVTLDLEGFRSGNLNAALSPDK